MTPNGRVGRWGGYLEVQMKTFAAMLFCGAVAVAGPAMAADPMAGAGPHDFSGPYIGASVGGQIMSTTTTAANFVQPGGTGLMAAVFAGLNMQNGNMVYGIEADVGYGTAKGSEACSNATYTCETYLRWQGSARARLGYAIDDFLLYVTGGAAFANFGGSTDDGTNYPDSSTRIGYTVGAGAEMALASDITGRVEYRYANYGKRTMTYDSAYPDVGVSTHTVTFGLAKEF